MEFFKLPKSRKRGFDLFQVGVAVVIGLMIWVGGMRIYNQVNNSAVSAEKARDIVAVASEIRAQYRTAGTYSALDSTDLEGSSFETASGFTSGTLDGLAVGTADADSFEIVATNLTESVCARLAMNDFGPNSSASCSTDTLTVTFDDF
jgi:hypothetical protein